MNSRQHLMNKLYHLYTFSENKGETHYWSQYEKVQWSGKQFGISENIKRVLPYDPAIPLLRIYPKEMKAQRSVSNVISRFIHKSQSTEQSRSPSAGEWMVS